VSMSDLPKYQSPNAPERLRRAVLESNTGVSYEEIERTLGVTRAELIAYSTLPFDPDFMASARADLEKQRAHLRSDDVRRETAAILLDGDPRDLVHVSQDRDTGTSDWFVSLDHVAASTTFEDLVAATIEVLAAFPGVERVEHVDRELLELTGGTVDAEALEAMLRQWWVQQLRDILGDDPDSG
jgi:hypothetical protein